MIYSDFLQDKNKIVLLKSFLVGIILSLNLPASLSLKLQRSKAGRQVRMTRIIRIHTDLVLAETKFDYVTLVRSKKVKMGNFTPSRLFNLSLPRVARKFFEAQPLRLRAFARKFLAAQP